MQSTHADPRQQHVLEAADRVARAAYIWIRHGNCVEFASQRQDDRQDLIAGVIFGLCNALQLNEQHALLSAYAFALIDGEAAEALLAARSMLRRSNAAPRASAYERGLRAARDLVALLEAPAPGTSERLLPI